MHQATKPVVRTTAVLIVSIMAAGAALASGFPLVAAASVALGIAYLLVRRLRRPASGTVGEVPAATILTTAARLDPSAHGAFVAALQEKVEAAQQRDASLTLSVVTPRVPLDVSQSAREAAIEHIRASIDRITRTTDHWGSLGDGRFGVILENCTEDQAIAYGERLAVAIENRPLISDGSRVEVLVATVPTSFDANQFYGAADFLAAAEQRATREPLSAERLVADTRLLRQRLYGKDYGARAA